MHTRCNGNLVGHEQKLKSKGKKVGTAWLMLISIYMYFIEDYKISIYFIKTIAYPFHFL